MGPPDDLDDGQLVDLVRRVFAPSPADTGLLVLVDLPRTEQRDTDAWRDRRSLAADWAGRLSARSDELGLAIRLAGYPDVGANNAELPERGWGLATGRTPPSADRLDPGNSASLASIIEGHSIIVAPTQYSATAPLKVAAERSGYRAATMPGFSRAMIPALALDYREVDRRVHHLADLLTEADRAELAFAVAGDTHRLTLDLRHRTGHASGGLIQEPGSTGNLPSGESYVVPYEGELPGDPSRSRGVLPVQLGDEVVLYTIAENQAVGTLRDGPRARREAERLAAEPAYGNLAELGLGVLSDFGLEPIGEILLDEKLGLHIAFGRSDHFGGQVGPGDFSSPAAVVHIDRVYLPKTQPDVRVLSAELVRGEERTPIVDDDRFVVDFGA